MRVLHPELVSWGLVIPVLVASWAVHWHVTRSFRRRSPIADRFAPLSRRTTWRRRAAVLSVSVLAAAALVFALVRPQAMLDFRIADYEREDLIVILDRSISMRAHDVLPSRFSRATLELRNFLKQKPDGIDRVGLVGFADSSLALSYLTADVESILFYLDWLDEDRTPLFGTNIGAALTTAMEIAAKDRRPTKKRFLLVSDGEDHGDELKKAVEAVVAKGFRVDCIGIGSDATVPIPIRTPEGKEMILEDDDGSRVTTRFEEGTLRQVAAITGGQFLRSASGTELARAIPRLVNGPRKLLGWRKTTVYRDLYPAGLGVAAAAGIALWLLL
jgi:Ca-activated chloride channel homolog